MQAINLYHFSMNLKNDIDFNINTFTNGESFLKEQDKYDVVFMDIELPGMNGMETITKLRQEIVFKNEGKKSIFLSSLLFK